jgi:hypothetical protein
MSSTPSASVRAGSAASAAGFILTATPLHTSLRGFILNNQDRNELRLGESTLSHVSLLAGPHAQELNSLRLSESAPTGQAEHNNSDPEIIPHYQSKAGSRECAIR